MTNGVDILKTHRWSKTRFTPRLSASRACLGRGNLKQVVSTIDGRCATGEKASLYGLLYTRPHVETPFLPLVLDTTYA
jgi:hypothetical protein